MPAFQSQHALHWRPSDSNRKCQSTEIQNPTSDSLVLGITAVAMVIVGALLPKHAADFLKIIIPCLICFFFITVSSHYLIKHLGQKKSNNQK